MKIKLLFFFLAFATLVQAQYSYVNDRRFYEPNDLIGYDFKPAKMEVPNEWDQDLAPGEYSFGISFNHLYVKGGDIEGVYNINNIQPVDYGFKLLLMNARDARLQGHLKVIQNKYGMVEALIFKRSPDDKEIIFYQTAITEKLKEQEREYFTDRGELVIEEQDSLWGKTIYPFLIIHEDAKVQQRLRAKDSLGITFVEEITIEEKEVKKKKSKKGEEESSGPDSMLLDSLGIDLAELDSATLDSLLAVDLPEKKIKIIKEYFVVIDSYLEYEGGIRERKQVKFPIKKVVEREDEEAALQEERYQWEFVNDKKELIHLYINGDHTVSTMQVGEKKYLMRGF